MNSYIKIPIYHISFTINNIYHFATLLPYLYNSQKIIELIHQTKSVRISLILAAKRTWFDEKYWGNVETATIEGHATKVDHHETNEKTQKSKFVIGHQKAVGIRPVLFIPDNKRYREITPI